MGVSEFSLKGIRLRIEKDVFLIIFGKFIMDWHLTLTILLSNNGSAQTLTTFHYINASVIPSELSHENFISSHVKTSPSLWLHNKSRL